MAHLKGRHVAVGEPLASEFTGTCCWPNCDREIGVINAPLCKPHLIEVYVTTQETYLWMLEPDAEAGQAALRAPVSRRYASVPEQGLVYFVRLGSLVKIGFTTDLDRRMKAVPHEEILATTPGTMQDERGYHAAFAHLRVVGEWFTPGPDLMDHIATLAA
jgi:hypothetical protein